MAIMPPMAVIEFVDRDVDAKGLDTVPVVAGEEEAAAALGIVRGDRHAIAWRIAVTRTGSRLNPI